MFNVPKRRGQIEFMGLNYKEKNILRKKGAKIHENFIPLIPLCSMFNVLKLSRQVYLCKKVYKIMLGEKAEIHKYFTKFSCYVKCTLTEKDNLVERLRKIYV